jgi:hypothetical protein
MTKLEPSKVITKVTTNRTLPAFRESNVNARDVFDKLAESFDIFAESPNVTTSDHDYALNTALPDLLKRLVEGRDKKQLKVNSHDHPLAQLEIQLRPVFQPSREIH